MDDSRCKTMDGNERCCLTSDHSPPHMGRWYTMKQEDIDAFSQFLAGLTAEERAAMGIEDEI